MVAECARRGWVITDVLLTHHHWDHVDGLPDLHAATDSLIRVWGAAADAHRLPALDHALHEGDVMAIGAAPKSPNAALRFICFLLTP